MCILCSISEIYLNGNWPIKWDSYHVSNVVCGDCFKSNPYVIFENMWDLDRVIQTPN